MVELDILKIEHHVSMVFDFVCIFVATEWFEHAIFWFAVAKSLDKSNDFVYY